MHLENILIITSSHDIPIAEGTAAEMASYKVYFFDPTLVDVIRNSALRNTELIVWDNCLPHPEQQAAAHEHAHLLEQELERSMRELLPKFSISGWQHLNLYYFFLTYHWYSGLWKDVLGKLEKGRPYVFLCDNPSNYYWPSFLPALLLLQQLKTCEIPFSGVTYGKRPDESDVLMNLCDGNPDGERYDLLTHLPTCFYDANYFQAELQASGKSNINIEPKYWSIALGATRNINLVRLKDQQILSAGWPALGVLEAQLAETLDALLTPFIVTPDYRARQVGHLSNLYQAQIVSFHLLERYFQHHRPGKMLLSDHDAGFHGPLISFAEKHNIPVLMLPHSKVCIDVDFTYNDITMLSHPIQGQPLVNGRRKRLLHFGLAYPEEFSGRSANRGGIKKVGLLLNGFSLNGIQCTDFPTYVAGIRQIDAWCRQRGIELSIRAKPGGGMIELLSASIPFERAGLEATVADSLQNFVRNIDLCLMYDAPTSAATEFLRKGVPILNPIPAPLSWSEALTTSSQVVPKANIDDTLAMVDAFIGDNSIFHTFSCRQFGEYVSLFSQSHALRSLL